MNGVFSACTVISRRQASLTTRSILMAAKQADQTSRLKRAVGHPILSGLIVAAVVTVAGSAWATVKGAWPAVLSHIWSWITATWLWLGHTTGVWNWLLILLTLVSLGAISGVAVAVLQNRNSPTPLTQKDYRSDSFEGLRWYWSYDYFDRVSGLYACCPDCLLQLEPKYDAPLYGVDRITYACEHCKVTKAAFTEHHTKLEGRVERFIHKKLRTGEWEKVLKIQPAGGG